MIMRYSDATEYAQPYMLTVKMTNIKRKYYD